MVRTQYPEDFEEFWSIFDIVVSSGLGQKGNKKRAYRRYLQKKIGPEDFDLIKSVVESQVKAKQFIRGSGRFDPDFMHVEGWINNERWDDEINCESSRLCESDRKREAALRNYLEADMGKSLDGADCTETHIEGGGGRVIDMRVLET